MTTDSDSLPHVSENSVGHWVLFGLTWAEERGVAPIARKPLRKEMGEDAFNASTLANAIADLRDKGLVYLVPEQMPPKYEISEHGKDVLVDLGPPSRIPTRSFEGTVEEDELTLPDAVNDRPGAPDTLRVDADDWSNDDHLFREDEATGDLVPLCSAPVSAPQAVMSINPEDLKDATPCSECTARATFEEWLDAATSSEPIEKEDRWDRYDEWIAQRDFDEESAPKDALESGDVLVSREYMALNRSRKLHAFVDPVAEARSSEWFTSMCGLAEGMERRESLEPMAPEAYVHRSDACKRCRELVEATEYFETDSPTAKDVNVDPFGVFDDSADEEFEEPDPESAEPIVCLDCGREFDSEKGLTIHWGHPKSDCEYPVPDERERAVLTGLWLVGGERAGKGTPLLRKTSVNRESLEWLNDNLGQWSGSVDIGQTEEKQRENVAAGFGYEGAESQTQYRLTTRTCPWLDDLAEHPISDIELAPLAARILYSFRGHTVDDSVISIRHPDGQGLRECLESAGFDVQNVEPPAEGKNQCRITLSASASREFADWVGEPLPGFENKAFEFRDTHSHKERDVVDDEPVGTISFEPDWEWVGVQLYKLGLQPLARRAFKADLSPAEVYGPGGIESIIRDAAYESDADLDMGGLDGGLTIHELPVDPEEAERIRQELGVEGANGGDGGGGGGGAPA